MMKKIMLLISLVLGISTSNAQEGVDSYSNMTDGIKEYTGVVPRIGFNFGAAF